MLDAFTGPGQSPSVTDYLAVGQKTDGGSDERVVLFIKLGEGEKLTAEFESKIKAAIRTRRSARHVPSRVSAHPCFASHSFQTIFADHPGSRHTIYP